MNVVAFLRNAVGIAQQARQNVNGLAAAEAAYSAGAGLQGWLLAFTGTTATGADDLVSVFVMESLATGADVCGKAADTCEAAAKALGAAWQTAQSVAAAAQAAVGTVEAGGVAARQLQTFLQRLQSESLRDVLEG